MILMILPVTISHFHHSQSECHYYDLVTSINSLKRFADNFSPGLAGIYQLHCYIVHSKIFNTWANNRKQALIFFFFLQPARLQGPMQVCETMISLLIVREGFTMQGDLIVANTAGRRVQAAL